MEQLWIVRSVSDIKQFPDRQRKRRLGSRLLLACPLDHKKLQRT